MAKGAPKGKGIIQKPTGNPVVGYGAKGHAFHSVEKFNASKAGNAKTPTAKNAALSGLRREISTTNAHPMPYHSPGQQAHFAAAEVSKPTPVPKTPAGMKPNPVAAARGIPAPRGMK